MVWRKRKGSNFPTLGFTIPGAFKVDMAEGEGLGETRSGGVTLSFDKTGAVLTNREVVGSVTRPSLKVSRVVSGALFGGVLLSCFLTSVLLITNIGVNFPQIDYDYRYPNCFIPPTVRVAPLVAAKLAMCAFTFLVAFFYVLIHLRGPKPRSILAYTQFFWLENRLFAFLTAVFLVGTVIYSFLGDPIRADKLPPFEVLLLPVFDLFLVISPRDSRVARWLFRLFFLCLMLDAELRYLVRGLDNNSCAKLKGAANTPARSFTAKSLLGSLLFTFYGAWLSRWHAVCGRKCRNPQEPGSACQRTTAEENIVDISPVDVDANPEAQI